MAFSLYDLSIPVMIRGLGVMSQYLELTSAFAAENNISPTVLVEARLAPDMLPFARGAGATCRRQRQGRYCTPDRQENAQPPG
jgi:hypothetical protein